MKYQRGTMQTLPAVAVATPVPQDLSSLLWAALFILVPPLLTAIVFLWRRDDKRREENEKRLLADIDDHEARQEKQLAILGTHATAIDGLTAQIKALTEALKRRTR